LDGFALPREPSQAVSLGQLLGDFERYIRANPHQAQQLLGTLTGIAFRNGCLTPEFFPPPMVDEFGRIGAPAGDAPKAPYKTEGKAGPEYERLPNGNILIPLPSDEEIGRPLPQADASPPSDAGPQPEPKRYRIVNGEPVAIVEPDSPPKRQGSKP